MGLFSALAGAFILGALVLALMYNDDRTRPHTESLLAWLRAHVFPGVQHNLGIDLDDALVQLGVPAPVRLPDPPAAAAVFVRGKGKGKKEKKPKKPKPKADGGRTTTRPSKGPVETAADSRDVDAGAGQMDPSVSGGGGGVAGGSVALIEEDEWMLVEGGGQQQARAAAARRATSEESADWWEDDGDAATGAEGEARGAGEWATVSSQKKERGRGGAGGRAGGGEAGAGTAVAAGSPGGGGGGIEQLTCDSSIVCLHCCSLVSEG
jgi:hypothetical protein